MASVREVVSAEVRGGEPEWNDDSPRGMTLVWDVASADVRDAETERDGDSWSSEVRVYW